MGRKFHISVSSDYCELWRYNLVMMCSTFNSSEERLRIHSVQSHIADVGENLLSEPAHPTHPSELSLTTDACHSILLNLYIVAHTLPRKKEVQGQSPFTLRIKVSVQDEKIYDKVHYINLWGGDSISLKLPR